MIDSIFTQLGLVIIIATIVAAALRILKQPLIIGYIITGILVGPLVFNITGETEITSVFAKLGIAFLLFIVGLHLDPDVIKKLGKVSIVTGLGQVVFTSLIGFLIAYVGFGFDAIVSLYIGLTLTMSSTIIIMKLLSDKNDLETLYGKIASGFLIVQDIVAIFILMLISSVASGGFAPEVFITTMMSGIILFVGLLIISKYLLPPIVEHIAKSTELLILFSLSWCLALSILFDTFGFSIEIGALLAGITLAGLPYAYEISSRIKPLRDFFIIMFFIILGSQMQFEYLSEFIVPALIFSLFVFVGNPLIFMVLMGSLGFTKRNSFMAGITTAQISEFSLIIIALGVSVGHLTKPILGFVTMIGIITILGSTYMIMYSNKIYKKLSKHLKIFERKGKKLDFNEHKGKYDIILFGCDRMGFSLLKTLGKLKHKTLVVDYNPDIIMNLMKHEIPSRYGDIDDPELISELKLKNVKMIISTIPAFEANINLLKAAKRRNKKIIMITNAKKIDEALELYREGADYVIMPHFLGAEHASHILKKFKVNKTKFTEKQAKHIKELVTRKKIGQEHPTIFK
ncbi:MAG: sodium:proton exchanger [Candidatus Aenigmarchaeota archaeon]|nr:sodium:proton exchanger [Candidatus Aenigmarchaeota archaeon]